MSLVPRHHPAPHQLRSYVTGEADQPLRLLVEAHLCLCARCAARVGRLSAPGGKLLESAPELPVPAELLSRILARLPPAPPRPVAGLPLPEHLLAELPPVHAWHWQPLGHQGGRIARLLGDEQGGSSLSIIHLPPGASCPRHRHETEEDSLVLGGGVLMGRVLLEAGDWRHESPGTEHEPVAEPGEGCWTLYRGGLK
jgi:putative transcriptional regulator